MATLTGVPHLIHIYFYLLKNRYFTANIIKKTPNILFNVLSGKFKATLLPK